MLTGHLAAIKQQISKAQYLFSKTTNSHYFEEFAGFSKSISPNNMLTMSITNLILTF